MKFNKLWLTTLLCLMSLLFACGENQQSAIKEEENNRLYFEDGETVSYEGDLENGIPNGEGVQYHPNGTVKFEGNFINGEIYEGIAYRGGEIFYEGKFKNEQPLIENVRSQEELRFEVSEKQRKHERSQQGVRIGMTQEEVLLSNWGSPLDINKTTNAYGTSEQWVYSNYNYLYFDDGILTSIQN